MAELNKKLHLLKPNSPQEDIKLYSTLAEVGDNYWNVKLPAYNEYYKWTTWAQPVLSSNTSFGTVTASTTDSSNSAWKALDAIKSGTYSNGHFWATADGNTTGWWKWVLPYPIKISQIVFYNRATGNNHYTKNAQFFADEAMTIPLGAAFVGVASNFGVSTIVVNNVVTDTIYFKVTSSYNETTGIGELEITATYAAISTASDYDYSVEVPATQAYAKLAKPTYYKWTTWAQPVFTTYTASDGSVISASSEGTSWNGHAWRAMDGHTSGGDGNFWGTTGTSTGWWKVVFPYKIAITKLVHYNRDNTSYSSIKGQYFADVAMTIPIGSPFTNTTSWGTTTVYDSSTPIVTDTIYFNKTAGNNSSGIGELVITAKKATALPIIWNQPILSANGTFGIGTFSCRASSEYYPAWKAFNGTTVDGNDCWFSLDAPPQAIYWYSVVPINISNLQITNRNMDGLHAVLGAIFQGSNDGSTWETIKTFTNAITASNASWNVSTPSSNSYTYFRLFITASDGQIGIGKIAITATEVSTANYAFLENPVNASSLSMVVSGVKYKVLTKANLAYTEVDFTTAGTFTWTAPVNVKRIRLAMVGGGAGCSSSSNDNGSDSYYYSDITSSFFGSYATSTSRLTHSASGYALGFNTTLGSGSFGCGGPSVGESAGYTGNTYNGYIDVVAGQSYNIKVGAANQGGTSGFVKIAYGGDI